MDWASVLPPFLGGMVVGTIVVQLYLVPRLRARRRRREQERWRRLTGQ